MKFSQRRLARPSVGGMLATRQGSLVLALMCAVAAAGVLMFALGRYRSKLNVVPQQATVLVATGEIKKGETGSQVAAGHLYKSMPIVASQLSSGALSNASGLNGQVAQADILPGQQLTAAEFSTQVGPDALLSPDQRAISVTMDEAHGDTDALQAGDHVDVYATFGVANGGGSSSTGQEMVLLVPDALVIKPASATPVHAGGRTIAGGSLVLAVSSAVAPQVDFASDNGKLFLALRPTDATAPPSAPTTLKSILAAHAGTVVGTTPGGGS